MPCSHDRVNGSTLPEEEEEEGGGKRELTFATLKSMKALQCRHMEVAQI